MKNLNNLNQIINTGLEEIVLSDESKEEIYSKSNNKLAVSRVVFSYCIVVFIIGSLVITSKATGLNTYFKYIPGVNKLINTESSESGKVELNINIPKDENIHVVDIPFKLNNIDLNIVELQKQKTNENFDLRLSNGTTKKIELDCYSLKIKIRKGTDSNNVRIRDFSYNTENGKFTHFIHTKIDGMPAVYTLHNRNETWNSEYKVINLYNITNADDKLSITFDNVRMQNEDPVTTPIN